MLLPLIRSDAVGAILAELLIDPTRELSVAEVSRRTGVHPSVAQKEVARLVAAAMLSARAQGNNRLVRANTEHPLFGPVAEIITATYGPVPVLRELLAPVDGVEEAYVFGSWAARRRGTPGGPPQDVDVLVVGPVDVADVAEVSTEARDRTGVEINLHRVSRASWDAPDGNPFLETVRSRPMMSLVDKGAHRA